MNVNRDCHSLFGKKALQLAFFLNTSILKKIYYNCLLLQIFAHKGASMKCILINLCLFFSAGISAADQKGQFTLSGFPNGNRICGAEFLEKFIEKDKDSSYFSFVFKKDKDFEYIFKKCNMQDTYTGAFNEVLDAADYKKMPGSVRRPLFDLGVDYGIKKQKKNWEWKMIAMCTTAAFVFTVGFSWSGYHVGRWYGQEKAAKVSNPKKK